MDKQFNINELLNSNILTELLEEGGILQESSDSFILLIGPKTPFTGDLNTIPENQYLVYQPNYWDYLHLADSNGLYHYRNFVKINREDLGKLLLKIKPLFQKLNAISDHHQDFKKQFDWSHEHFNSDELKKTVPFTQFEFQFSEQFNFLIHLLYVVTNQNQGLLYGFWNTQEGHIGLTPETLANWNGTQLKTMALAGTWATDQKYETLDQVDAKTREEHNLVIQDILNKLPNAKAENTEIQKLKYLNHLKTDIAISISSVSEFYNSVVKLHPTAALGLYPYSKKLAAEYSNLPLQKNRGFFGAPVGYLTAKSAHVYVGIRCFSWNQQNKILKIICGCGVTQQSVFADEWAELQTKKMAIAKSFNLQITPSYEKLAGSL